MREPVRTAPRGPVRDPMNYPPKDREARGVSRWLWIGGLLVLALILVAWLSGGADPTAEVEVGPSAVPAEQSIADPDPTAAGVQGNDAEAVTDAAPLPVDDAEPNAVPPQDALIPPAPIEGTPPQ